MIIGPVALGVPGQTGEPAGLPKLGRWMPCRVGGLPGQLTSVWQSGQQSGRLRLFSGRLLDG